LLERAWRRDEDVAEGAVEILGLITVEDVLEELIGEEIQDEDDYVTELTRSFPPRGVRGGAQVQAPAGTAARAALAPLRLAREPRRALLVGA
jgi:hypothetical protein